MEMEDLRAQPWPERRARIEPLRRRGGDALAAAGADTAMAVDAGNDRADRGPIEMVVGVDVGLIVAPQPSAWRNAGRRPALPR